MFLGKKIVKPTRLKKTPRKTSLVDVLYAHVNLATVNTDSKALLQCHL